MSGYSQASWTTYTVVHTWSGLIICTPVLTLFYDSFASVPM